MTTQPRRRFLGLRTPKILIPLRQIIVVLGIFVDASRDFFEAVKRAVVQRMFWGRGALYKNSFHIVVITLTISLLFTGVMNSIVIAEDNTAALAVAYGAYGNDDLLLQGNSIRSVRAIDDETNVNYRIFSYTVKSGDNLNTVASKYGVSKNTVRWSNPRLVSPYHDQLNVGAVLRVPEIDGVLHEVQAGDTVDKVATRTRGDRFSIIELNDLVPPKYNLKQGQLIFVPGGSLPSAIPSRQPGGGGYVGSDVPVNGRIGPFGPGSFDDPLTNSRCGGYSYRRGFSTWHKGVDLGKTGGCPIRAIAAGRVLKAGWLGGKEGFGVTIDHGGGVVSGYFHGDGNIWVKAGQTVSKGQDIMYMGCTGACSGTHLHFSLAYFGAAVNPAPYVPYRR